MNKFISELPVVEAAWAKRVVKGRPVCCCEVSGGNAWPGRVRLYFERWPDLVSRADAVRDASTIFDLVAELDDRAGVFPFLVKGDWPGWDHVK